MGSSFKGVDLFGSGPHRFSRDRLGQVMVSQIQLGTFSPETIPIGPREQDVMVVGRLVASDETGLWALRDAVVAVMDSATVPPVEGMLIDQHGREWPEMAFIEFVEGDRVDRGRVVSLGYEARFRALAIV